MIFLFFNQHYGRPFLRSFASHVKATGQPAQTVLSAKNSKGSKLLKDMLGLMFTARYGISTTLVRNVNDTGFQETIEKDDVGIIAGFNQVFAEPTISRFRLLVNFHPSLLPHYRGPTPSHWCLANREAKTGFTLHKVTQDLDAGEILYQEIVPIEEGMSAQQLDMKIAVRASRLLVKFLDHVSYGEPWDKKTVNAKSVYRTHVDYLSFPGALE